MIKKLLAITAIAVTMTGCATQQQNGQMLGAMVGYAVGNQIGGGMGNVAATAIGTMVGMNAGGAVGANMDRPPQVVYVQDNNQPQYAPQQQYVPTRSARQQCWDYPSIGEREACVRGVEQAERRLQRQREDAAYRAGQTYAN